MTRVGLLLVTLVIACGHRAEPEELVAPAPAPMPTIDPDAVALELEIHEPHDGTTVARPALVTRIGKHAEVSTEFTVRPVRRTVRRLAIELTPTRVTPTRCEIDVRSQVLHDPRMRIAGSAKAKAMAIGEWAEVVTDGMVGARVRCVPPAEIMADSPRPTTRGRL